MKLSLVITICMIGLSNATSTLTIMVESGKDECFYITKKQGETITASFQVMQGDDIDFTLLDPRANVIYQRQDTDGYDLEQQVHVPGDYGFCFSNAGTQIPTGVHFEWDFHLGNPEEASFKKKLEEEKRRYLMNKIKENQPKIVGGAGIPGVKPVEMHGSNVYDNYEALEMDSVAHALLLLSFNFDRMEHYMNLHKSKQALSHNIQIRNGEYINYHSFIVITLVVLMAMVQVIVVKSFFSGKINLKIWEF